MAKKKEEKIESNGISEDSCSKDPEKEICGFKNVARLIFESEKIEDTRPKIVSCLNNLIKESPVSSKYTILFLYDPNGDIMPYTADRIYKALPKKEKRNILLIIHSSGGRIEPAYLISKCCKEYSDKFVVSVPRKAKSAATLISLGADEIHMGIMSELGPIDPQFGGLPALGLSSAVEYLAGLCKSHPESGDMLAKYLS